MSSDNIVVTLDMDWELLREQKEVLIHLDLGKNKNKLIEGIISVIDAIQDQAVDENAVPEKVVFGKSKE